MAGEWETATIDDIKADMPNAIAMGPFGSRIKTDNFVSAGVPVIRGNNLNGERLLDDQFVFLTKEKANELRASNAVPGDIVITHRGTLGQVGIIPYDARYSRYVVSQSQMKLTVDRKKVDPFYIFYYLRSSLGQHELLANTSQTGVPAIARPTASLRAIAVPLPPLEEQRAIAHILGTLDDKIELNRRMNETLEAMARAIFKSWLVDFDPVRAKAGSRDTGLPEHIADLFPDHFEDSELGEIPAGWKPGRLGQVADNLRRGIQAAEIDGSTPYIGLEHMPRRSIALTEWESADELQSNKFEFKRGEILFGKLRPYFHKVGVAPTDGVCSTDILVVVPKRPEWFGFTLGHVSSTAFIDYVTQASTGTKMPRTNWGDMANVPLVVPPLPLATAYNQLIEALIDRISVGIHESHTLAATRDALLPKLISGELRVPDAQRLVDGVMP